MKMPSFSMWAVLSCDQPHPGATQGQLFGTKDSLVTQEITSLRTLVQELGQRPVCVLHYLTAVCKERECSTNCQVNGTATQCLRDPRS